MIKKAGLTASDITEMPAKLDITPVLDGQTRAWPGYVINEVLAAQEKGFDVNVISPTRYGISLYADTLFTTEAMLKDKPQLVRAFVSASCGRSASLGSSALILSGAGGGAADCFPPAVGCVV